MSWKGWGSCTCPWAKGWPEVQTHALEDGKCPQIDCLHLEVLWPLGSWQNDSDLFFEAASYKWVQKVTLRAAWPLGSSVLGKMKRWASQARGSSTLPLSLKPEHFKTTSHPGIWRSAMFRLYALDLFESESVVGEGKGKTALDGLGWRVSRHLEACSARPEVARTLGLHEPLLKSRTLCLMI